jgi:predicted metal-dependent phosphoesterase TrpH
MKPGRIDLHLHTAASDGSLSPRELVVEAAAQGVTLLAVTDHDTVGAVAEAVAAGSEFGVTVIPGVEIAVDSASRDIHLLGYYLRWGDEALQAALARLRGEREARNARIVEKLRELKVPVDLARVQEISGSGSVGRPHIAAALVEAGHVASQSEAFWRYLGRGKPAFVSRVRLPVAEALRIITGAGGLAALAHAAKMGSVGAVLETLGEGVEGLEVFHSDHTREDTEWLLKLARERSLLVTGGTDSHGPRSDRPTAIGSVEIPAWVGEAFLARAPQWWREGFGDASRT